MLVLSDAYLFQRLKGIQYPSSLPSIADEDDIQPEELLQTPDTAVRVVRFNSSEYLTLLGTNSNPPKVPFISVQTVSSGASADRGWTKNARRWVHTDSQNLTASVVTAPQPWDRVYQLDIRSPKQWWANWIEQEITRQFAPVVEHRFQLKLFGNDEVLPVTVRWFFDQESTALEDMDVEQRLIRLTRRVRCETFYLPGRYEVVPTIQTVEVTVSDLGTDSLIDTVTIP